MCFQGNPADAAGRKMNALKINFFFPLATAQSRALLLFDQEGMSKQTGKVCEV